MAVTVKIDELISEFGTFIGQNESQILKDLLQTTYSMKYMRTVKQNDDFRAAKALIASIVQGFQKTFTPKGRPEFTPIVIGHRRHKFDVSFYPDEIVGSWLGFMDDETKDRKDWPLTKYILYKMLIEQVAADREMHLIGTGVYEDTVEGVAQETGKSMDGFLTILEKQAASGTSAMNFSTVNSVINSVNAFAEFELFADIVVGPYRNVPMNVFCSEDNFRHYVRKKRDLYGGNTDYEKFGNAVIDGTRLTITPLPSMNGSDIIFATPKENFIRLIKQNDGASRPFIESSKREVSIYADWHENVGFAIAEAVFAFVPSSESASS